MQGRQAIAIALLGAALAVAGCGLGPADGLGRVELTVTRDYGAEQWSTRSRRRHRIRHGDAGARTQRRDHHPLRRRLRASIDGWRAAASGGRSLDWFFYVNGVEATVGAADVTLQGGEAVWWDYHDWSAATSVPAVVGSWPQPFAGGYEGHAHPTVVECRAAAESCATVEARLRDAGATLVGPEDDQHSPIRVLVGPWSRMREDSAASQLQNGPAGQRCLRPIPAGGGGTCSGLDQSGEEARRFGPAAGLVAATRHGGAPPTWMVTGVN